MPNPVFCSCKILYVTQKQTHVVAKDHLVYGAAKHRNAGIAVGIGETSLIYLQIPISNLIHFEIL